MKILLSSFRIRCHVVVNIDGHWRFTRSLILGSVEISRGVLKLIWIFYLNKKNIKKIYVWNCISFGR